MTCGHNDGASVYTLGTEAICMRCGTDPTDRWECPYCGVPKPQERFHSNSDACEDCEKADER